MIKKTFLLLFIIATSLITKGQVQPFPSSFDMARWVMSDTFPKVFNRWTVEYEYGLEFTGWTEGVLFRKINLVCDTCNSLDKYTFDIVISYGRPDKEFELSIIQNKDTTKKYFDIKYLKHSK